MVYADKKFHGTDFLRGACFFLFIYRGLVARGPAGSAIKKIADEAILSAFMIAYVRQNLKCSQNKESLSIPLQVHFYQFQ